MRKKRYYRIREKGRHPLRNIGIVTGIISGILFLFYIAVTVYFSYHFYPGTIIHDKDFSWKSAQDVERYFEHLTELYQLKIIDKAQKSEWIDGNRIDLKYNPGKEIQTALNDQNSFLWFYTAFHVGKVDLPITVRYDNEKLKQEISNLYVVKQEQTEPASAFPVYKDGKYVVKKEEYGTALDLEKLEDKIAEYISSFQPQINLIDEQCYKQPVYTAESPEVLNACEKMNMYCHLNISYDFGKTVIVTGDEIAGWLTVDDKMNVSINENAVKSWVSDLAGKYNTAGTTRNITTPNGKTAQVTGGTYGWEIDETAEVQELIECLKKGKDFSREPVYKEGQTAASHEQHDWGDTYLEVDITQQYMWYIENGNIKLEAPVVTGLPQDGRDTPEGVYSILEMLQNTMLRGSINPVTGKPSYEQPVSYWMRITWSGIGFHDADWQEQFGGTWYKEHGSHGCINMRPADAGNLYKLIDYGLPVIVHY